MGKTVNYNRKKRALKIVAAFMALNLLAEIFAPTVAWALTSGPSQPEVQSFEPAGTSDMVDVFSGDFNYNIPLFDLPGPNGGYPINLAYHSGIGMDQEASWVGLGWNINPGAINRDKRGLPDDFNGDPVSTSLDMAPNITYGGSLALGWELWGGDGEASGSLSVGITIYNNSFKGMGYSFEPSMSFSSDNAGLGLGLSLDSQEGVGASADVSYGSNINKGVGLAYNSQEGLSLSAHVGHIEGSYTFSEKAFMPAFGTDMTGTNLRIALKLGGDLAGALADVSIGGFYRKEEVKNVDKTYNAYGYNYLQNARSGNDLMDFNREKDGIIRKETPNLPSPVMTFDTYMAYGQGFAGNYRAHRADIGHFHDPEVNSKITGGSIGVDLGLGYPFQIGLAASFNSVEMNSGDWNVDNDFQTATATNYQFIDGSEIPQYDYENLYYKVKGEPTSFETDEMDYIGQELAVSPSLKKHGSFLDRYYMPIDGKLQPSSGPEVSTENGRYTRERIKRNNSIQPITNSLLMQGGNELLGEFDISYFNSINLTNNHYGAASALNRSVPSIPSHHNAGFTCINPAGLRYVYALPAYNISEKEQAYSINHDNFSTLTEGDNFMPTVPDSSTYNAAPGDKFKTVTNTPKYAHAYLLTSVLGTDYVDLTGDGPTDDDYGYWVKFNYVKTENYNWRTPYEGGMYLRGKNVPAYDDKTMFNYGEKEMWYLGSAETKSHIAVFKLSPRHDARGATGEYVAGSYTAGKSYELDEINLFSKQEYSTATPAIPLKTVHFTYSYDLCKNVPNNLESAAAINEGKLTLKRVWFTYQNDSRGSLSPYTFDYHESDPTENPDYNAQSYDRWGGYKDTNDFFMRSPGSGLPFRNLPYVSQFDPTIDQTPSNKATFKEQTDKNAAVWNLKEIGLPTGGSIEVNYESDDYAYVQHRQATQMLQVLKLGSLGNSTFPVDSGDPSKVYDRDAPWLSSNDHQRRVYFKLETPIKVDPGNDRDKLFNDYISGLREADGTFQMYFRVKSNLRDGKYETVSGYANIQNNYSTDYGFDPVGPVPTGAGTDIIIGTDSYHTVGYITMELISGHNSALPGTGHIEYHPFAVAAWQFMRINEPELLTAYGTLSGGSGTSASDHVTQVASLLSVVPAILQTFQGYRRYAYEHSWGQHIDLDKSFIRLSTPDKIKFGGGNRVKKIIYHDNWANSTSSESSNTYGQVYKYTITEGTGGAAVTYSSGVAQYEPIIGGDEIALRHAKPFLQNIPLATDNNLFYEYPINEAYYPGASVGYSHVTVQSLGSFRTNAGNTDSDALDPHINSTGSVEYEFYTAKEYPVITDETNNEVRKFNLYIPIPLVGQINRNKLFETQGYAITLNDMHGKLKSIKNYAKNINGEKVQAPVSSVAYEYRHDYKSLDGQTVKVLNNTVPVIVNESINATSDKVECNKKSAVVVGEEYDFFTDSRMSKLKTESWGLSLNIELAVPIAIPCPWPAISSNAKVLKTFVTNKLIHKAGILTKTVATDGLSTVTTENKLFDAQTGAPILTQVSNDFDKPVYNYTHPARWEYDGMGSAAQNHNFTFYAKVKSVNTTNNTFLIENSIAIHVNKNASILPIAFPMVPENFYNLVAEGDELIIQKGSGTKYRSTLIAKNKTFDAICGVVYNTMYHTFVSNSYAVGDEIKFIIVRSGRRNLLTTDVGSIAALKDPTDNANRALQTLTGTPPCLASEVASLLNNLLAHDCNLSNGSQLSSFTAQLIGDEFYDENGNPTAPGLSSMFNYIKVTAHLIGTDYFYFLEYSYINEAGACVLGECNIGSLGVATVAGITYSNIHDFAATSCNSLTVNYTYPEGSNTVKLDSCMNLNVVKKHTYIDDVISSSSVLYRNYWDYDGQTALACSTPSVDQTNLYSLGKKGIWKPNMNYYYKDQRVNQSLTTDVTLKHDGVYKGDAIAAPLNEFYLFVWKPTVERPIPYKWLPNSLVSMYDQNSNAVQTRDIIGLYSTVGYGYNGQLPIIQGNNAERKELFYESFDDPFSFLSSLPTANIKHTGKKSLVVIGNNEITPSPYTLKFQPGKNYTLSLWVSQNKQPATYANTPDDIGASVIYYNSLGVQIGSPTFIRPSGNVIEYWQRIEGNFTVPTGTASIRILLQTDFDGGLSYPTYFDDIRIFPTQSNVSTSVYDANNFRVSAVLDANNFATFYNYDEEGKLFLVKKETIDGIKTIKEERRHLKE